MIELSPDDVRRIAAHLGRTVEEFLQREDVVPFAGTRVVRVTEDEPCPFLDGDACSIQDVKPTQCRAYPFWPELVSSQRSWRRERKHCPGIGRGRARTPAEVAAIASALE